MVKNRKDLTPRRSLRGGLNKVRQGSTANLRVVVRVRPHNEREQADNHRTVIKVVNEQALTFDPEEDATPFYFHGVPQKGRDLLKKAHRNMRFNFDRVFHQEEDNEEVFVHSTKSLIETLMDGCNCSVFVYGATGAGKTHTMLGNNSAPGITFLTMRELFRQKDELSNEREFELGVSYLEVYNENVQDLLKPGGSSLHLREDSKLGVMVAGITLKRIENPDELFELLEKGNKNRTQHPTDANAESSRSHAVFQVYIRMSVKSTGQSRLAKLSMIDLAGSERGAATGCKGARFTEGANINRSLLALGNCINSLADGQRHVPYRDSKLTRLLKDSLGGNCHTVMIANISPSSLSFEDTYNTLKYATRAKKIKSNVKKNVVNSELSASQYMKLIEDKDNEILKLREMIKAGSECENCKNARGNVLPIKVPAETDTMLPKLLALVEESRTSRERLQRLKSNKKLLEVRVTLKQQANNRLSDFCLDTPDKKKGHLKFEKTMDRLRRQATGMVSDFDLLEAKIKNLNAEIDQIVNNNPHHKSMVDVEQMKTDKMIMEIELAENVNIFKLQENEITSRGLLEQDMACLLQPWFCLLRGSSLTTEAMEREYANLQSRLHGACTVSFEEEDPAPAGLLLSVKKSKDEELRAPVKRKLPSELNSTFVLDSAGTSNTKICADHILAKVLPSPAKKLAKSSPRIALKENKLRKPIGTMGTATRFASASASVSKTKSTIRPVKRELLTHR